MKASRKIRLAISRIESMLRSRYDALFPDPTTVRLMQILGSSTLCIGGIRKRGRPMTIVLFRGWLLRSEHFKLVYIDGKPMLSNDLKMAISVEDDDRVRDILVEQERKERLEAEGYYVQWIPTRMLNRPGQLKQLVARFI